METLSTFWDAEASVEQAVLRHSLLYALGRWLEVDAGQHSWGLSGAAAMSAHKNNGHQRKLDFCQRGCAQRQQE